MRNQIAQEDMSARVGRVSPRLERGHATGLRVVSGPVATAPVDGRAHLLRSMSHPSSVLWLQRVVGNQVVTSMYASRLAVDRCGGAADDRCACQADQAEADDDRAAGGGAVQVQRQVTVQRRPTDEDCDKSTPDAGGQRPPEDDDCGKLIPEEAWKVKGPTDVGGYDTGNYYKDVSRVIVEGGQERGVAFEQALFIVAQAREEQGTRDPSKHRYRVLNMQVRDADTAGKRILEPARGKRPAVWINPAGHKFVYLDSKEGEVACQRKGKPVGPDGMCVLKSAFYVYESMEEQVNHYLDEMESGHFGSKGAGDILFKRDPNTKQRDPNKGHGSVLEYGEALQRAGYASAKRYVEKMCANYNIVLQDMRTILDQAIVEKTKCLQKAQKELADAWACLNQAKKELAEAEAVGPAKPIVRIMLAKQKVAKREQQVAEKERKLKEIEEKTKEHMPILRQRRQYLDQVTCRGLQAPSAPPTPS